MILETKKLWFKKAQIFLDDDLANADDLTSKYDSVVVVSHNKLDLVGFNVKEKDTAIIDLNLSLDEIFKKFSDTTRNEIRRTYSNPDLVFKLNSDFDTSYNLYKRFEKSQGRKPVSKKDMRSFKFALALYKGEGIYGFYIIESFPYARIRSIFSKRLDVVDKEIVKIISNAGRRLLWEILTDLKNRNFVFLDMASVNMENPKTQSIAKFKMSFGGAVIKEYIYMYQSKIYDIFSRYLNLGSLYIKLVKIIKK